MILVLNCGSSSIKYQLFGTGLVKLSGGLIEHIGETGGPASHADALAGAADDLHLDSPELTAIGHRVVHGGSRFVAPTLKLAVFPEHRLLRRRRAERGGADRARDGGRGGARRRRRTKQGASGINSAASHVAADHRIINQRSRRCSGRGSHLARRPRRPER